MDSQSPIDTNPSCNLCGRVLHPSSDDLEIFSLCGDCKALLLQDLATPAPLLPSTQPRRRSRRRRRLRIRSRPGSSESVGDLSSSHTTPQGSTRWRLFSESDSEDFEFRNLETESNASFSLYRYNDDSISFSAYGGGYSDASNDFDTDIDPMHAGLNQWNSDEDDERGSRVRYLASPSESYSSMTRLDSPELERGFRQRIIERRQALSRNFLEDMDYAAANVDNYLDERGFEELLEQLAESDSSRRGAPPASASCVRDLPRVFVGDGHVKKGLACAICKEVFALGNETTELPCLHLYHAHCIMPWLGARNSCPLCRYELPTDDRDYEEGKQNVMDVRGDSSSSSDDDDRSEEYVERGENEGGVGRVSRGRWLFMAAAPVVSLVGVVLAMWLSSNTQRRDVIISHSPRESRTRRWLPFF